MTTDQVAPSSGQPAALQPTERGAVTQMPAGFH